MTRLLKRAWTFDAMHRPSVEEIGERAFSPPRRQSEESAESLQALCQLGILKA